MDTPINSISDHYNNKCLVCLKDYDLLERSFTWVVYSRHELRYETDAKCLLCRFCNEMSSDVSVIHSKDYEWDLLDEMEQELTYNINKNSLSKL